MCRWNHYSQDPDRKGWMMMMMTLKGPMSWLSSSFFLKNYQLQCYKQQFKPWKTVGVSKPQFQSVVIFFQFVHRCLILYLLLFKYSFNILSGYNFLGFSQFGDMSSQSLNSVFEVRLNLWHNSFKDTYHQAQNTRLSVQQIDSTFPCVRS